jgi:uncharacterized protein
VPAVLVDAGPLVALVDRDDSHHETCRRFFGGTADPFVTVWPAFAEAMYLLRAPEAQRSLWELAEVSPIEFAPLGPDDMPAMRDLMRKYRDLPMDLADAALVRVAEREGLRRIFTLDRRDFSIYRPARLGRFVIVP